MAESGGFHVWVGGIDSGWFGCGIIVGGRHAMSCNHVVRECLGLDPYGGQADDLVGQEVVLRIDGGTSKMRVIHNVPLPALEFGQNAFDDLCILERSDGGAFADSQIAAFMPQQLFTELRRADKAKFSGTGLTIATGKTAQYISIPFEGRVIRKADYKQWYHTSSDLDHLATDKGCSGAAAISEEHDGVVLGLVQGGLSEQKGLMIPAWIAGRFLEERKIQPKWSSAPPIAERRRSPFVAIRKPSALGLKEVDLADCDRVPQRDAFQSAKVDFVNNGRKLLFAAVSGRAEDLPQLSNQKFGSDSVNAYWEWMRFIVKESAAGFSSKKQPSIFVKLEAGRFDGSDAAILAAFANAAASDQRLKVQIPHKDIVIGVMDEIDAPIVIYIWCEAGAFSETALDGWFGTISEIAHARKKRPIILFFFVDCTNCDILEVEQETGITCLPPLGKLTKADVRQWADAKFGTGTKKANDVLARVAGEQFTLTQLRDWLLSAA